MKTFYYWADAYGTYQVLQDGKVIDESEDEETIKQTYPEATEIEACEFCGGSGLVRAASTCQNCAGEGTV